MTITFTQLAEQALAHVKKPLSIDDVWKVALDLGLDKQLKSVGMTPTATVGARLYSEVRYNSKTIFAATGGRPKLFYLKHQNLTIQVPAPKLSGVQASELHASSTIPEKDLHPYLAYFLHNSHFIFSKTLNHSKSKKSEFGEWVHPDMVGCYFPFTEWNSDVAALNEKLSGNALKLYSFELKRKLDFSNLRESFFQAVSNSSWANEGFLVSANISSDPDFNNELERLSSAFGIGIIEILPSTPNDTKIKLPAKHRENVDWETINKLSSMNPDFLKFLQQITKDLQIKDVRVEFYDKFNQIGDLD
jgi:hypothetical protein